MNFETYLNKFTELQQYKIGVTQRKGRDYAGLNDPFKNFKLIEVLTEGKISAAAGILVRLTDKLQRVANLLARPAAVADEKITDTLVDLANYSDILFLLLTENMPELPLPKPVDTLAVAQQAEVSASIPEGASPNTAEDAYEILVKRVEEGGIMSLDPTERSYLKMLIEMKLGPLVATEGAA